jgi:hypothetical protein
MALKGHNWFLYEVLKIERAGGPMAATARRLLDLGLGGKDGTRGHVFQAIGGVQVFFQKYPAHKVAIANAPPGPFIPTGQILDDWKAFLGSRKPGAGTPRFGYSFDTLRRHLRPKFGGKRPKGGGGDNEFHLVLRLGATFL